jgi:thiol-disulfide isomerase/thioredoxin
MVPLDVRTDSGLGQMAKRIFKGPMTVVLVYADWCGHCHDFMPTFDKACKNKGRSVQAIKVNETMMDKVNSTIQQRNSSAKPMNASGYPIIFLVDKNGNPLTEVPKPSVEQVMNQAGSIAEQANAMNVSGNMSKPSMEMPSPKPSMEMPSPKPSMNISITSASQLSKPSMELPSPMKPAVSSFKPNTSVSLAASPVLNTSPMSNIAPFPKSMVSPMEVSMEPSMEPSMETPMDSNDGVLYDSKSDKPKIGAYTGGSLYKRMASSLYTLSPASMLFRSRSSKKSTRKVHFRKHK